MADSEEANPVGRPLKYETVAELDRAIASYFKACDPHWVYKYDWVQARNKDGSLDHDENGQIYYVRLKVRSLTGQQPYTMAGLARHLGIDRKTLHSYKGRLEFLPSILAAKDRCEEFWEGLLASPFSNGAKFNLTNNYDEWRDKQVLAGDPDAPLMPVGLDTAILNRRTNGSTASSTAEDSTEPDTV